MLTINTNISSMVAERYLGQNTNSLQNVMTQLSSGYRINNAGDDPAGLQLSQNLQAQINGTNQAINNTQDGINVLNIAGGALKTITDNLQRVRELAVQASNDTYNTAQRAAIQVEMTQMLAGIDQIANAAQFDGVPLLSAAAPATFTLQIGPNTTAGVDTLNIASALGNAGANALGITDWNTGTQTLATLPIDTSANAQTLINECDTAITNVNTLQGNLGSFVDRLQGVSTNLTIGAQNLTASQSSIQDVNIASATADMSKDQVLQQASVSILAQANQTPQLALQLIKNA